MEGQVYNTDTDSYSDVDFFIETGDIGSTLVEDDELFDNFRAAVNTVGTELIDTEISEEVWNQLSEE